MNMSRAVLLAGLMATTTIAQADLAADGFQYVGCVQAANDVFPVKMDLGEAFTVEQCQEACRKKGAYAAAAGNGCHCNDPASRAAIVFDVMNPSRCSEACKKDDEKAGMCGGPCSAEGQRLYNLYQRINTDPVAANATATANKTADKPTSTLVLGLTSHNKTMHDPSPSSAMRETAITPGSDRKDPKETGKVPRPPTARPDPPSASESVTTSDASTRPASTVMAVLSISALVLAVALS